MRRIFKGCPDAQQKDMLNELLVDHYSNTLFLVWQRSAVKGKIYDKEQAIKYLMRLLLIQWYQPLSPANNTVTKREKLPENGTVFRKLSIALRLFSSPIFVYSGAILALP